MQVSLPCYATVAAPRVRRSTLSLPNPPLASEGCSACAEIDLWGLAMCSWWCRLLRVFGDRPLEFDHLTPRNGAAPRVRRSTLLAQWVRCNVNAYSACAEIDLRVLTLPGWCLPLLRVCGDRPCTSFASRIHFVAAPRVRRSTHPRAHLLSVLCV